MSRFSFDQTIQGDVRTFAESSIADTDSGTSDRRNRGVRITRSVFVDLSIWMIGVGVLIGAAFPLILIAFGMPREVINNPYFLTACLLVGVLVGAVNLRLMRTVVMPRLRSLVDGMMLMRSAVQNATFTGNWSHCDPDTCGLTVDSKDVIGETAAAFNSLLKVLQRSHEIEESISDFSKSMASQLELAPLCAGALDGFLAATSASAGAILVDVGGELSVLTSAGIVDAAELCESDHVRLAMVNQTSIHLELPEGLSASAGLIEFQPREVAFIPLVVQDAPLGVVVLARSNPFERESRQMSEILTRTFAIALSNAVTHEHLQRVAALDPLTDCYNRRFGMTRLREEFNRARRTDSPLSLVMFDIDHFKSINDTYGHLVGDRVIANVAQTARRQLRDGDILVRYGGEEFLCILPGVSKVDAASICERIRAEIEDLSVIDRKRKICCTVSVGFATGPSPELDREMTLLQAADDALYRAKRNGRNEVVASNDQPLA